MENIVIIETLREELRKKFMSVKMEKSMCINFFVVFNALRI